MYENCDAWINSVPVSLQEVVAHSLSVDNFSKELSAAILQEVFECCECFFQVQKEESFCRVGSLEEFQQAPRWETVDCPSCQGKMTAQHLKYFSQLPNILWASHKKGDAVELRIVIQDQEYDLSSVCSDLQFTMLQDDVYMTWEPATRDYSRAKSQSLSEKSDFCAVYTVVKPGVITVAAPKMSELSKPKNQAQLAAEMKASADWSTAKAFVRTQLQPQDMHRLIEGSSFRLDQLVEVLKQDCANQDDLSEELQAKFESDIVRLALVEYLQKQCACSVLCKALNCSHLKCGAPILRAKRLPQQQIGQPAPVLPQSDSISALLLSHHQVLQQILQQQQQAQLHQQKQNRQFMTLIAKQLQSDTEKKLGKKRPRQLEEEKAKPSPQTRVRPRDWTLPESQDQEMQSEEYENELAEDEEEEPEGDDEEEEPERGDEEEEPEGDEDEPDFSHEKEIRKSLPKPLPGRQLAMSSLGKRSSRKVETPKKSESKKKEDRDHKKDRDSRK